MKRYGTKTLGDLEEPHSKPELTTPVGRFADRATYQDIFTVGFLVLIFSTLYFRFGPEGHTLDEVTDIWGASYFSVVTFSSLGYGDFAPVGFGRLIATFVVISGLCTIALVIGKLASEKSLSVLTLLHRSDVQRRLMDYAEDLTEWCQTTERALGKSDVAKLEALLREQVDKQQKLRKYVVFHLNQSTSLLHGNEGTLANLFGRFHSAQVLCLELSKFGNLGGSFSVSRDSEALIYRFHFLTQLCSTYYEAKAKHSSLLAELFDIITLNSKRKTRKQSPGTRTLRKMDAVIEALEKWRLLNITVDHLEAVLKRAPCISVSAWPDNFYKEIASEIGISNGRVSRHIDRLKSQGRLTN